mgnify:CR=1
MYKTNNSERKIRDDEKDFLKRKKMMDGRFGRSDKTCETALWQQQHVTVERKTIVLFAF